MKPATARRDASVSDSSTLATRLIRAPLHLVPDTEATLVTEPPEEEIEVGEHDYLDTDSLITALMEQNQAERQQLRQRFEKAEGRIESAEVDIVRLRQSNRARRAEIGALQTRSAKLERSVHFHDLAFKELDSVTLPWMDRSIAELRLENDRLHNRVRSLEAWQNGQARATVANLAMPRVTPVQKKGLPTWLYFVGALVLAALGSGLAMSLLQ